MKLNTKITIEVNYNEEIDSNKVSFSSDLEANVNDIMTSIKLAQNAFETALRTAYKRDGVKEENLDTWLKKLTLKELYATE